MHPLSTAPPLESVCVLISQHLLHRADRVRRLLAGAEAGLNLHGLPSNQKPAEAAGQSSGIDRSGSVRSLDASVGATGGLFNSSMSDLSGAFNGASSDLLANQGLFSASRADTQTQVSTLLFVVLKSVSLLLVANASFLLPPIT